MRPTRTRKTSALVLAVLLVSLPIAHAETLSLTYDANGNLVSGDGFYRVYDDFNQLWKVYNGSSDNDPLLQEYTYHPSEERVLFKKTYQANGSLKEEVRYLSREFVQVINETGTFNTTYVYLPGDPGDSYVAEITPDGTKQFVHGDIVGSTSVVTNDSGDVVERTSYTPYGASLSGGQATRYTYEAKEHDGVVGDTDFHFRKYNPEWRVFTQPDSLLPNVYDPQELNRYAFERNNPLRYTDPDGHNPAVIGAVLYLAFTGFNLLIRNAATIVSAAARKAINFGLEKLEDAENQPTPEEADSPSGAMSAASSDLVDATAKTMIRDGIRPDPVDLEADNEFELVCANGFCISVKKKKNDEKLFFFTDDSATASGGFRVGDSANFGSSNNGAGSSGGSSGGRRTGSDRLTESLKEKGCSSLAECTCQSGSGGSC